MKRLALLALVLLPARLLAGYTETAPPGLLLVESRLSFSAVTHHFNDQGELGPLLEPLERYEPGGGLQGILEADAEARYTILINFLTLGVTETLTALVAVPVVLHNAVEPRLGWTPGDYSPTLGRAYTEQDFWDWAASMGQPKPGAWSGNEGALSDVVLGARWRFTDGLAPLRAHGISAALTGFVALPTGRPPDPEELAAGGTASWFLHAQGEAGLHLGMDKSFHDQGWPLLLGLDLFHEAFLPHGYASSTGSTHPLLLNVRPYVGERYVIDPGDFTGAEFLAEVQVWRGPTTPTWLSGDDPSALPPVLTLSARPGLTLVGQSDWQSESALWDWRQERFWRPGYKVLLTASGTLSLLRFGVPLQLTGSWRRLLAGRNARAPGVVSFGVQVPVPLW